MVYNLVQVQNENTVPFLVCFSCFIHCQESHSLCHLHMHTVACCNRMSLLCMTALMFLRLAQLTAIGVVSEVKNVFNISGCIEEMEDRINYCCTESLIDSQMLMLRNENPIMRLAPIS